MCQSLNHTTYYSASAQQIPHVHSGVAIAIEERQVAVAALHIVSLPVSRNSSILDSSQNG